MIIVMKINNRIKYLKKVLAQHAPGKVPDYLKDIVSDEEWFEHNNRPRANKLQLSIDNIVSNIITNALSKDLDGLMKRVNDVWDKEYSYLNKINKHISQMNPEQVPVELLIYVEELNQNFEKLKKFRVKFFNEVYNKYKD